ncbi:hypothetical protein MCOR27_003996 [Pyricularia oryzae]|uniref:Uncharacterized protein n=1 Tax=Pyricularia grisea TaxID=148305 RepID=A0ABQ8N4P7_PYRGI|nr:hypothetical protein MCOR26_010356 [Pyricularia oryzae]KAI6291204.1 hypothetical protein MCOR33_010767 [Pyricularia grisea]KAI6281896.1 hypothetical protein MCOR27_003996 [Pyricularia oryzae]KAI6349171.1 hypothetical protein MCOR28_001260 [Pyricularia oryzae]KAI6370632.1 hypothetical protein MCOR31_004536 [Pyricularia oryzae]
MRSSTLVIVPFYFLAGLVAASADKAHDIELDFEGPPSGWCGPFKADKKRPGKGNSGCDPFFATVPTGRDVKFLNGFCTAGGDLPGHVGCA